MSVLYIGELEGARVRADLSEAPDHHREVAIAGASAGNTAATHSMADEGRAKRERKAVDTFVANEIKQTEELVVPEGEGSRLGDIENVKIKIEKFSGASEELKTMHRLCYGRVGKQTTVKKFLRDFCGFAKDADVEKKTEVIMKLDGKMIKTLLVTCDIATTGTKVRNARRAPRARRPPLSPALAPLAARRPTTPRRSRPS